MIDFHANLKLCKLVVHLKTIVFPARRDNRPMVSLDYIRIQMLFILLNKSPAHGSVHSLDASLAEEIFVYAVPQIGFFTILMKPSDDLGLNAALLLAITAMLCEFHFRPPSVFFGWFLLALRDRRISITFYRVQESPLFDGRPRNSSAHSGLGFCPGIWHQ